jgi:aconitate hydratase
LLNSRACAGADLGGKLSINQDVAVHVTNADGTKRTFQVRSRLDTEVEIAYYRHGGILNYVVRKLASKKH